METLDLYTTRTPTDSIQNGRASFIARVLWCSMYYMDRHMFCASELGLVAEKIYGERVSSAKVSHGLRPFVQMGFVEKFNHRNRSVRYYNYRVSQCGVRFMRNQLLKEETQ